MSINSKMDNDTMVHIYNTASFIYRENLKL